MKGSMIAVIAVAAIVVLAGAVFVMSGSSDKDQGVTIVDPAESRTSDTTLDTGEETDSGSSNSGNNTSTEYPFSITYQSGTDNAYSITSSTEGYTVVFSGITEETS